MVMNEKSNMIAKHVVYGDAAIISARAQADGSVLLTFVYDAVCCTYSHSFKLTAKEAKVLARDLEGGNNEL
jgi:hypothetical protein